MLPSELPPLPAQAQEILHLLERSEQGMRAAELAARMGLSERGFGKAIRRLVTLRFVNMPAAGLYALTGRGREAMALMREAGGSLPMAEETPEPPGEPEPDHTAPATDPWDTPEGRAMEAPPPVSDATQAVTRQLAVLVAEELVAGSGAILMVGFNAPRPAAGLLAELRSVLLRVSAHDGTVEPPEQPLDVLPAAATGPVRFKITPHQPGSVRIRIEVVQDLDGARHVTGGMFFELRVQPFPTPRSAEFQSLGADIRLL